MSELSQNHKNLLNNERPVTGQAQQGHHDGKGCLLQVTAAVKPHQHSNTDVVDLVVGKKDHYQGEHKNTVKLSSFLTYPTNFV